mmetsp:Transcript_70959/g.123049  ORF Transcript_70959/g.123049 Transcript_70959/m.123049 type:complete len:83 (+) Transcript_70959:114-362(+)
MTSLLSFEPSRYPVARCDSSLQSASWKTSTKVTVISTGCRLARIYSKLVQARNIISSHEVDELSFRNPAGRRKINLTHQLFY